MNIERMTRLTQGDMSAIPLMVSDNILREFGLREDSEGNQEWVAGRKSYGPQRLDDTPIPRITELLLFNSHDFEGGECLARTYYNGRTYNGLDYGLQLEPCASEMREIGEDHLLISGSFDIFAITAETSEELLRGETIPDFREIVNLPYVEFHFMVREAANFTVLLHRRWIPSEPAQPGRIRRWPHRFDVSEPILIRRKSSLSAEFSSYFHDKVVDPEDGTILCSQMVSETMSLDEMEHWLLEQLRPSEPQRFTRKSLWKHELVTQVDFQDEIRLDDLSMDSVKGVVFGRLGEVPGDEWESKKRETLFDYCHFEGGPLEPWISLVDDVVLNYRGKMLNVKSGRYCLTLEAHTDLNPLNYRLRISDALRQIKVSYVRSRISASNKIRRTGLEVKSIQSRRLDKSSGQNFQIGLNKSTRRIS